MTNLKRLGVSYTVLDYDNGSIRDITVVDSEDLYALTERMLGREHLETVVDHHTPGLKPFTREITDIAWYAAPEDKYQLEKAILFAKRLRASIVVVEKLPLDK